VPKGERRARRQYGFVLEARVLKKHCTLGGDKQAQLFTKRDSDMLTILPRITGTGRTPEPAQVCGAGANSCTPDKASFARRQA